MQGGPPGGEPVHLGPEPFGGGQGYGVQVFQLPCRRLKQDDLPLMPPEEFLLVPGLAVLVIQGTELAVGGGVLHGEGQPLHLLLRCPEIRFHPGGGGRRPVATLGQLLIAGDPMFGQEVQRFSGPFQILDGRPVLVTGALLGFEIVLDVDEQAGLPGALLRLAGGAGPSGHLGGQGLLGIIGAQGFQSGEPFLARSPGGYVLAPFQFVPFPLKAAEQADSIQIDLTQPAEEGKLPLAASYLEKYTKMEKSGKSLVDTFNAITVDQENRNVCMMGDHGFGLTSVGEDFARSFYDMGICKAKTIAKIKAQALNKVKLADAMSKLAGGCMVVENAGLIAPDKMTELMKLTAKDANDVVVILTGATESINRLFGATGDAKDKFTHQINMEGISTQDMLAIAKGYFKQQGFKTDDSVEGTVKNLLMAMESGNIDRMLKACDEAMLKCDDREKAKGSSRKYLLSEDFK